MIEAYYPGQSNTPQDVIIMPRRMNFDPSKVTQRYWMKDDPVLTHFFNAGSSLLPVGEHFFIRCLRPLKNQIYDAKLKQDLSKFCGQEGHHANEHSSHIKLLAETQGYSKLRLYDKKLERLLAWVARRASLGRKTAIIAGIEHLTSIMAENILRDHADWDMSNNEIGSMLVWHLVEETEHKTVAYDVCRYFEENRTRLNTFMVIATAAFIIELLKRHLYLLKKDKLLLKASTWSHLRRAYFSKEGALRKISRGYFNFFKRDFFPWQIDNRDTIQPWVQSYNNGVDMRSIVIENYLP